VGQAWNNGWRILVKKGHWRSTEMAVEQPSREKPLIAKTPTAHS
jgi:hypothetical protein